MTQIAHPLPAGPTTEVEISAFESYVGHKLPADYREFLLRHNGGHPEPDAIRFNAGSGNVETIVMCFFPMHRLNVGHVTVRNIEELRTWPLHCAWDDLQSDLENSYSEAGIEETLLPIGTDGSSNYFCIVLDGGRAGATVFLDHETGETFSLSSGFTAFLASLCQRERSEDAFGSEPRIPNLIYDKIGTLITSGACVQCGGSGKCYCIRKGRNQQTGCVRCNGSGKCAVCQGSGKSRR